MSAGADPKVAIAFLDLAQILGRPIQKAAAGALAKAVRDLPGPDVIVFLDEWLATTKHARLPLPSEIRAAMKPETVVDDDATARETAARIIAGVKKIGPHQEGPAKKREVREYLGSLAMEVVEQMGGWNAFCAALHDREIPAYTAQIRDLTKSVLLRARAGTLDKPAALPEGSVIDANLKTLIASTVRTIEPGGEKR